MFEWIPIPEGVFKLVHDFAEKYAYQEFVEEIRGIAKVAEVRFELLLLLNFFYEISTFKACSTVIARNADNRIVKIFYFKLILILNNIIIRHFFMFKKIVAWQKP